MYTYIYIYIYIRIYRLHQKVKTDMSLSSSSSSSYCYENAFKNLNQIEQLEYGWYAGGPHAREPGLSCHPMTIINAKTLLFFARDLGFIEPHVAPSTDGEIYISWRYLKILVFNDACVVWDPFEETLSFNLDRTESESQTNSLHDLTYLLFKYVDNIDEINEFKFQNEYGTPTFQTILEDVHEWWYDDKTKRYFEWLKTEECKSFKFPDLIWM